MLPSILTAFLFALSGICGRRAAVAFGSLRGNVMRLTLSMLLLGAAAGGLGGVAFEATSTKRLLLSGAVGFGLGDVALFLAYPRLGARRTLLVNLCSAPVFGAVADWLLVGGRVTMAQVAAGLAILAGVAMALRERTAVSTGDVPVRTRPWAGWLFALMAGLGQGGGAALTRYAHAAMHVEGRLLHPMQQAFVRTLPGLVVSLGVWLVAGRLGRERQQTVVHDTPRVMPYRWWWLVGAALFGPALGVTCFQWALSQASTAVVLSIVAATPIVIIPLAAVIEKDRPGRLAFAGSCLAVAGVIAMTWVTAR